MNFPMKSDIVSLVSGREGQNYIYGKDKNYIIPEYQREYSWGESQIDSFMTSLKRALDGEYVFMGTVQFACDSECPLDMHVIDGQQRMTTFLLLYNILEKLSGYDLIDRHGMHLEVRNFASNNAKLSFVLSLTADEIRTVKEEGNRYLENSRLLLLALEELLCDHDIDGLLRSVQNNTYFVELVTEDIPLPQVVSIFNTINTTGLDLDCSDIFKLQYYEYLKKNYPEEGGWMRLICDLYEDVNREGYYMNDILSVYKHCIVARHSLGWERLSQSNESFFEDIFTKREPEPRAEILRFDELKRIVEIFIDLSGSKYGIDSIDALASDVIEMTRYSRYWTLPCVCAYFNGGDYTQAFSDAMACAKYFVVCSVNFDKVINPVQTFMCNEILPAICRREDIAEKIDSVICEAPYGWSVDYPNWNKNEFIWRIGHDLFMNGKRAYIICTLSALLEEGEAGSSIETIKGKLFDWSNFQYDIEHICARDIFERADKENFPLFNGIGNLVVLNRSINRGIGNDPVSEKVKEYESSKRYGTEPRLVSVTRVAESVKLAGLVWDKEQVEKRYTEQTRLLCSFLGLE